MRLRSRSFVTKRRSWHKFRTERFASPLNVSELTAAYYSVYERDAIFGAQVDAYSCRWLGSSEANPEYNVSEMDRALRWAIKSAGSTSEPVLSAFVLPAWRDSATHMNQLKHPLVQVIATIPTGRFNFVGRIPPVGLTVLF